MESVPPCNSTSRLAIVSPSPSPCCSCILAVELHVSADARDLFGGKSAALIADGQDDGIEGLAQCDAHRRAGLRKI